MERAAASVRGGESFPGDGERVRGSGNAPGCDAEDGGFHQGSGLQMKEWIAAPCSTARNDLMMTGKACDDVVMTGERCLMAHNGVMMFVTMAMTAVADE